MSVTPAPVDHAAARAPAARLLAAWWGRPVAEETARWAVDLQAAQAIAVALRLAPGPVDRLGPALAASVPAELLEEYERLLVGPGRVPCAPYESLWRTDGPRRERGVLMGTAASEVVRIYRELGLQVREDAHELPDHLAIECEALACAYELGADDLAAELLHDHLACWVTGFCAAVAAETRQPFYAALAGLTPEWAAALAV